MTDPRSRSTATSRWRKGHSLVHLLLVTALGGGLLAFGVVSGFAAEKTVQVEGSAGSYHWGPSSTFEINSGGEVEFKNTESIPHAVNFENPPAAPSCSGVPSTGTTGTWSGTCTFTQPGTYKFFCPVHPTEMKGTITVKATGPQPPIVTTEPASEVTETGAKLNGKVNPSEQATTFWFKYGTTAAYGQETTHESAGSGASVVSKSATISGLNPATTYHFQMVAENETGETKGTDRTFTTAEPPGPPTVTTEAATAIGGLKATLAGTINPKGLETTYHFNYGLNTSYGQETPGKSAGSGTTAVAKTEAVTGLLPETTYHFQVVAENSASGGPVMGADKTFTTVGKPLATTGQASGITDTAATLEGTVNPKALETTYHFEYGLTEAYGQETSGKSAGKGTTNTGVTVGVTELLPETTYHFRIVAHSESGTTEGADQTFTTSSAAPPPPPPPPPPTPTPSPTPQPEVTPPPETKITLKPAAKTHDRTPTIKFGASGSGVSYQCSVDSKPFKVCRSPFTAPSLKPGRHKIRVKAVIGGVADPTPATVSFKVVAAK